MTARRPLMSGERRGGLAKTGPSAPPHPGAVATVERDGRVYALVDGEQGRRHLVRWCPRRATWEIIDTAWPRGKRVLWEQPERYERVLHACYRQMAGARDAG